jgi:hypothetical protein
MNIRFLKTAIVAFFILALGYWSVGLYFFPSNGMVQWSDSEKVDKHHGSDAEPRWQENAYFFHGKDPYRLMTGQDAPIEGIGMMNKGMPGTMPWGPVLSQIIFPGFLPFSAAVLWGLALFIGLFAVICFMVKNLVLKKTGSILIALFTIAVVLAQYGFAPELKWLNIGGHVVGLLLIACLLDDKKYGIIVGVLLGFAMIKPQLAILFFLPHLARKNYKVIIAGVITVVVPYLINAAMFGYNPITQLLDYYEISAVTQVANGHAYFGFFDPLTKWFGVDPLVLSPIQMFICFIVCLILCIKFRNAPNYLLFSIPAVISTLWTYSNEVNLPVLALLIIAIILEIFKNTTSVVMRRQVVPAAADTATTKNAITAKIIFLLFALLIIAAPFSSSLRLYHFPILAPFIQRATFIIALWVVLKNYSISLSAKSVKT